MRYSRRPGFIALAVGVTLSISSAWFLWWAWSAASLRCVACDCRYDLGAANPHCRLPVILMTLAYAMVAGAIGAFAVAWLQRRRGKQTAT
jgi:hypothetical protein